MRRTCRSTGRWWSSGRGGRRRPSDAPICFGIAWGSFAWQAAELHAVNWVLTSEQLFYWVEPQTSLFYALEQCRGDLTLVVA